MFDRLFFLMFLIFLSVFKLSVRWTRLSVHLTVLFSRLSLVYVLLSVRTGSCLGPVDVSVLDCSDGYLDGSELIRIWSKIWIYTHSCCGEPSYTLHNIDNRHMHWKELYFLVRTLADELECYFYIHMFWNKINKSKTAWAHDFFSFHGVSCH